MMTSAEPILIIRPSKAGPVEQRVVDGVSSSLSLQGYMLMHVPPRDERPSFWKTLHAVRRCKTVIGSSPFIFQFGTLLLAFTFGCRIVLLNWDAYPVMIDGRRYDGSLRRRLIDACENIALFLAHKIVVPTRDFLTVGNSKTVDVPLWYKPESLQCRKREASLSTTIRVLFAGQINETRGLSAGYEALCAAMPWATVKLSVASGNPLPPDLSSNAAVTHLGFKSPEELAEIASSCDFGLVSLAPGFQGPGFPSKTFEYLAWGLPCIYFGPPLAGYEELLVQSGVGVVLRSREGQLNLNDLETLQRQLKTAREKFFDLTEFRADTSSAALLAN